MTGTGAAARRLEEGAERAREAGDLHPPEQAPDERDAELPLVPPVAPARRAHRVANRADGDPDDAEQRPPVGADDVGQADDEARLEGHRLPQVGEQGGELRQHVDEEEHERAAEDADEQDRIGERRGHVVAERLRAVEVLLQALQRVLEEAAGLARPDHVDEDGREGLLRGERLGERLPALHGVQHLGDHALQLRVLGEVGEGREAPVEGQARGDQRRQLLGHHRRSRRSPACRRGSGASGRLTGGPSAASRRDLADADRDEPAVVQPGDDRRHLGGVDGAALPASPVRQRGSILELRQEYSP
jgi:hypothetical protein